MVGTHGILGVCGRAVFRGKKVAWLLLSWVTAVAVLPGAASCRAGPGDAAGLAPATRPATTQPDRTWRRRERRHFLEALRAVEQSARIARRTVPELVRILEEGDSDRRKQAVDILARLGPKARAAIPALAKDLNSDDWRVRCDAVEALGRIGPSDEVIGFLLRALKDREAVVRSVAATTLGGLLPVPKGAVGPLAKALRDEDRWVRQSAASALSRMGPRARPAAGQLIEALKDSVAEVRARAALALGSSGSRSRETVEALAKAVSDRSDDVNEAAAWALGEMGPMAKMPVPQLTTLLGATQPRIRFQAAKALGNAGPAAAPALAALVTLLECDGIETRAVVAQTLGRIGPKARMAVKRLSALCEELEARRRVRRGGTAIALPWREPWEAADTNRASTEEEDRELRLRVVEALGRIDADLAVCLLLRATRDPYEPVRAAAARALAKCGPGAVESADAIAGMLIGPPGPASKAAEEILLRIGKPAVPALVKRLGREDHAARVVPVVERIDPNGLGPLVKALDGEDMLACLRAAQVLSWSKTWGKAAVPYLVEELKGGTAEGRRETVKALGRIGADALAGLARAARDKDATVRRLAVEGVGEIHSPAAQAVAVVVGALKDKHLGVRRAAAEALGRMRAKGPAATAALAAALTDEHWAVRRCAAEALGKIGPAARDAMAALEAAVKDEDEDVRLAAMAALKQMRRK